MKRITILILALTVLVGALYAARTVYIQKDKSGTYTDYFAYNADGIDTSRAVSLADMEHVWIDWYAKVGSGDSLTLGLDLMGQYENGSDWIIIDDGGTTISNIKTTSHGRIMVRNGDSCIFPMKVFKIRSGATVGTGDTATVWYILGGY